MKNKKLILFLSIIILIFILFLYFYLRSHDYTSNYKIKDIEITEKYHKELGYYEFNITYNKKKYDLISYAKYTTKRNLITDIKTEDNDENTCLNFTTNHVELYPICSNSDEYYSPYSKENTKFNQTSNYKNIKIASLENKTYLLWNYHEFIYLSPKKNTTISLFNKDIYNLNLTYPIDNYLLVPNYNEDYKFTKIYLINANNTKVKDIKLRYEVYFESYFLGNDKKKVYLYDQKNEQELYLDLKKEEIYKSKYKILKSGKWENTTNQKLKNNKLTFTTNKTYTYDLNDGILTGKMINSEKAMQVTSRKVNKIVKSENLDVYYISEDVLYYFNPLKGEIPLLKYSEWSFNNNNMIYIF